jgi:Fibrinogen beta and gamma chains, C-terminal globular domain
LIAPALAPEERNMDVENALATQFETPILASCDQKSGAGGWTVIQRRTEGTEEFNRDWAEYRAGFGSPGGKCKQTKFPLSVYIISWGAAKRPY